MRAKHISKIHMTVKEIRV